MAIKLFGAIAVIFACGAYGYKCCFDKSRRVRILEELITALEIFTQQISCTLTPLTEALKKNEESILFYAAEKIEKGVDVPTAFCEALNEQHTLTDADKQILTAFSHGLCAENKDGQISNARLCKERLITAHSQARQEAQKCGRLYKSGGVLIGILIALIML